jgi:hypothetical protein
MGFMELCGRKEHYHSTGAHQHRIEYDGKMIAAPAGRAFIAILLSDPR